MGRQEKPLDPSDGPVQEFACALRKLRREAGTVPYRVLAQRAGYSVTALSRAAAGENLPSLEVTLAYAVACGGDRAEWEERWHGAVREARQHDIEAPDGPEPTVPYRGLARYEIDDHAFFFGRRRLTEKLVHLVREHPATAVLGPSGVGKSSLLRAGLVPWLRQAADMPRPAAIRLLTPGPEPWRTHEKALQPADGPGPTWVIVDQFEELFSLCREPRERTAFLDALLSTAPDAGRLRVVIGIRADFYARCLEHPGLTAVLGSATLPVGPMSRTELREAIVRPAAVRGMAVEPALTTALIEAVADQPGGLPLMSHALQEVWRHRHGQTLTLRSYHGIGGVDGAVAQSAEDVYCALTPGQQDMARRILLRLITPGDDAPDTRRPTRRQELDFADQDATRAVLDRLARARLIALDQDMVDLSHEALLSSWPRFAEWAHENRERLRLHRGLTQAAYAWNEHGRDHESLYRGSRLTAAEEAFGAPEARDELTGVEQAFLDSGAKARRRADRRRRAAVTALCLVTVLALIAVTLVWQERRADVRQETQMTARRVAAIADSMRRTDPQTATRLSIAAWRIAETEETRASLIAALAQPDQDLFAIPSKRRTPGIKDISLSPDGRTLRLHAGTRLEHWDVRTHRRTRVSELPGAEADDFVLPSPDGRLVVGSEGDRSGITVWDTLTHRRRFLEPGDASEVSSVSWSDSGRVVVMRLDEQVELWDADSGRRLMRHAPATDTGPARVAVTPNGRLAVLCTGDRLTLWDLRTTRPAGRPLPTRGKRTKCAGMDLRFAPDNRTLGIVDPGGIRRIDVSAGRHLASLLHPSLRSFTFSSDSKFVAAFSHDEALLWRVDAPDRRSRTPRTALYPIEKSTERSAPLFRRPILGEDAAAMRIDRDSGVLRYLSSDAGGRTAVRTLVPGQALTSRTWQATALRAARFGPDARLLLTERQTTDTAHFRLLDVRGRRAPTALPDVALSGTPDQDPEEQSTTQLNSFSPDGKFLTYGPTLKDPQSARLWDVRRRTGSPLFAPHDGRDSRPRPLISVTLAPGSHRSDPPVPYALTSTGLWDLRHRRKVAPPAEFGEAALALHPGNRALAVGKGRLVRLPRGPATRHFWREGPDGPLAFSPDGSLLALGTALGQASLWDGTGRRRLGVLTPDAPRTHDPVPIAALAFSPDGRTLALADTAGVVQLWDVRSHRPVGTPLPAPGDAALALAFDRTGRYLHVAGANTAARSYDLSPTHIADALCRRLLAPLTRAEWQRLIPEAAFRRTC
ncbi:helix-turn-helix domain-containing protein [Streptomyces silaceus]|uniref:nSTAND1 domain-containing NTPase n=1 Tax=Streptomyces silaceus TaxID=545123 RepID=UPI0006EB4CB3|nr:helix-turn-helix domain-containing protein [Streptomyces silaceus]